MTDATKTLKNSKEALKDIRSSDLIYAKESLELAIKERTFITPYIPLIGFATIAITETIKIYKQSQYNKKIISSLLDRARLAEITIDQLIRRKDDNKKNFMDKTYYNNFYKFVLILDKIKKFAGDISQLNKIFRILKAIDIKEKFEKLTTEYDIAMRELKFTMIIANEQQRQIDQESLKNDISEVQKSIDRMGRGVDVKFDLIYEEVRKLKSCETIKIDSSKLTEPPDGREGDTRKSGIKRKIYMNSIEVACKPIEKLEENDKEIQRSISTMIKATQSPNIIQFYGLTIYDGKTVMVLEWAENGNLREFYLNNKGKDNLKIKLNYALDICRGIAYLNALEYYHHDLRCKNVVLTKTNVAKLTNFGFSRGKNDVSIPVHSEIDMCRWMAPEKLKDNDYRYDHKCEIYSFGMLLWELTFEKHPYGEMKFDDIEPFVVDGGREKIEFNTGSPEIIYIQKGFEKIIKGAWNQDPDCRISISKLLIDLDALTRFDQEEKSNSNKGDKIAGYEDDDSLNEELEPIPLKEGIKAFMAKNYDKALKCFERQAELNSVGKYWKARCLWNSTDKMDKITALTLFKEAADDDIVDAQYYYACSLKDAQKLDLEVDHDDFLKYLKLAESNNYAPAQFQIGEAHLKGKYGYVEDIETAKILYRKAALNGYKKAEEKLKELNADINELMVIKPVL